MARDRKAPPRAVREPRSASTPAVAASSASTSSGDCGLPRATTRSASDIFIIYRYFKNINYFSSLYWFCTKSSSILSSSCCFASLTVGFPEFVSSEAIRAPSHA